MDAQFFHYGGRRVRRSVDPQAAKSCELFTMSSNIYTCTIDPAPPAGFRLSTKMMFSDIKLINVSFGFADVY